MLLVVVYSKFNHLRTRRLALKMCCLNLLTDSLRDETHRNRLVISKKKQLVLQLFYIVTNNTIIRLLL
jgi:hypothetical protein